MVVGVAALVADLGHAVVAVDAVVLDVAALLAATPLGLDELVVRADDLAFLSGVHE
jgi:hypothetical protein